MWVMGMRLFWTLGSSAQGQGNAMPSQSGTGCFWGDSPLIPIGVVPGSYTLEVTAWSAILTLYNDKGKIIAPIAYFSGYASPSLAGFYHGTWASA